MAVSTTSSPTQAEPIKKESGLTKSLKNVENVLGTALNFLPAQATLHDDDVRSDDATGDVILIYNLIGSTHSLRQTDKKQG